MLRSLARDSAIYAAADLLVKSTQVFLTPYYLARLTVAEFGHFGVIVAILGLGAAFFNLGFQSGLIRYYHLERDRRSELFTSGVVFLLLTSAISVPIVAVTIEASGVFATAEVRFSYLLLLVASSALFGVFLSNGMALLKVRQEPIKAGLLGFTASGTSLVAIVILVEGERVSNLEGIILGQSVGVMAGVALTLFVLRPLLRTKPSLRMFRRVLRFSRPLVVHNGLHWLLNSADRFILIWILGAEALGGYFVAYQFGTGLKLVGRSLNSSVLHLYSESAADPDLGPQVRLASRAFVAGVLVLFTLIGFGAPAGIGLSPWEKFDAYLYLVPMVSGGAAFYLLHYLPMNVLALTLGRSTGIYRVSLMAVLVSVVLNVLLVPRGVAFAAIVNLATFATLTVGFLISARRAPDSTAYIPFRTVISAMGVMMVMALAGGLVLAQWM